MKKRTNKNFDFNQFRKDHKILIKKWKNEYQRMDFGKILKKCEENSLSLSKTRIYLLGRERSFLDYNPAIAKKYIIVK